MIVVLLVIYFIGGVLVYAILASPDGLKIGRN